MSGHDTKETGRRSRAALAVTLALLAALAPLSSVFHFLLVQHTVCADHGELIHASPDDATIAAVTAEPRAGLGRAPPVELHAHEECLVMLERRDLAPVGPIVTVTSAPSSQASHARFDERPVSLGWPLFRLAPKSSPPALA